MGWVGFYKMDPCPSLDRSTTCLHLWARKHREWM